ncbi:hypothetical protein NX059_001015 [Plenodomus lindquistii]|nr:hypothetical protein NX059_001015 [Plenodomus lindquistii]
MPYPPPDIGRGVLTTALQQHPQPLSQTSPSFLIIGLFALRLAKRLIEGLDPYPEQGMDIAWLTQFLGAYHTDYALAQVTGSRKNDYVTRYQGLISRMKRQPRYPTLFMQMNPDRPRQPQQPGREGDCAPEMSDGTYEHHFGVDQC